MSNLKQSTDFVLRPNTLLPEPSEHYDYFLLNHRYWGYSLCQALFENDEFLGFYKDIEDYQVEVDINDCSWYVKLPSSTNPVDVIHLQYEE